MTFVLTVCGNKSIWMMADRRLSAGKAVLSDDATKIVQLEAGGATALIGYAGFGRTRLGTQPSEWMARVLRGRSMTLEDSLETIARAMTDQFPRHLINDVRILELHQVLVIAHEKREQKRYHIGFDAKSRRYLWRPFLQGNRATLRQPYLATGTGANHFVRSWEAGFGFVAGPRAQQLRSLLNTVRAADQGRISHYSAAAAFAQLNHAIHRADATVGPNCLVKWTGPDVGGGFQYFKGIERVGGPTPVFMSNGSDFGAIVGILMEPFVGRTPADIGPSPWDDAKINERIRQLPNTPDEKLR